MPVYIAARRRMTGVLVANLLTLGVAPVMAASDGLEVIRNVCSRCHLPTGEAQWSRISEQRKTPEGWLMTIVRMQTIHGVELSADDRKAVHRYLSDRYGLAPAESEGYRYALERRLNTIETPPSTGYAEMCARCHSGARPLLQRRTKNEWNRLIDFHVGQWASIEYSQYGRDRDWLGMARNDIVPMLASKYPYDHEAWRAWLAVKPASETLAGAWHFSAHMPGEGDVRGVMRVSVSADDGFKVTLEGVRADGRAFSGSGSALLYSGHEWRGSVRIDGVRMRQVFSVQDGLMKGRMFETEHDERGLDFLASQVSETASPRLLAVQPSHVKAGTEADLHLVGVGLSGQPDVGPGVEIVSVAPVKPSGAMRVKVRVAADAEPGERRVRIGKAEGASLAVYRRIDAVKVMPDYAVARIGGNGGSMPKVQGRFDAEAWGTDVHGKAFRIGVVPARWSVEPFNEDASVNRDVEFAGRIDEASGIFTPGDAGPNPARRMSANNVGNLKVQATVEDAGRTVRGEGQLIVTVPRWNNPPVP
ncbi:MAG: quinohemoprotein amine dehydrogenase subunit alpha [Lautropia sp.]|nr:quinohemoprotein amine dehydrogenase subunit alpha [Lautropia sp.]